jgi:hypothetical protein
MLLYPLVPELTQFDKKIAELAPRVAHFEREARQYKAEIDAITDQAEVRSYLNLATRVRKREVVLTPEQEPLFQKMAAAVGPSLKAVAKISLSMKASQVQQGQVQEQVAAVEQQKLAMMRNSRCQVKVVDGDVLVRSMSFSLDDGPVYDRTPKEIKAKVRATAAGMTVLFSGSSGSIDWAAAPPEAAPEQ